MTEAALDNQGGPDIVARPAWDYRLKRFGLVIAVFVMTGWFLYDGYVRYPKQNQEALAHHSKVPNTEDTIFYQKVLGYALPPIGLALLVRWLYRSRGQVRLSGDVLYVPSSPPIPISAMKPIDEDNLSRWKRKGIVDIPYRLPGAAETALVRLDDDPYQPGPMGEIFKRIRSHTNPETVVEEEDDEDSESESSELADDSQGAEDPPQ